MPVLANPRYEAFAHAIAIGLGHEDYSQGKAYVAAGYRAKDAGKRGGSAEAAASRLLNKVKPILERVAEIQHECRKAKGVTLESIASELEEAREIARTNDQASAMVAASATKARLYGLDVKRVESGNPGDFSKASGTKDIASKLLMDAGARDIDDDMIAMAVAELQRHAASIEAIATAKAHVA